MQVRGRDFDEIHDLVAVRILVGTVRECYAAMGVVHALWQPMPGPVQGLHRAAPLRGLPVAAHHGDRPGGQAARSADPHPRRCTTPPSTASPRTGGTRRPRVPTLVRARPSTRWPGCGSCWTGSGKPATPASSWTICATRSRPTTSSSSRRRATSILCRPARRRSTSPTRCTPRSATAVSARGSTAGWSRWRAPSTTATSSRSSPPRRRRRPARDWLSFVASPRAKTKIRQWFAKERREEAVEHGKDAITRATRARVLPVQRLISHDALAAVGHDLGYRDIAALYAAVGENHVSAQTVVPAWWRPTRWRGGSRRRHRRDADARRSVVDAGRPGTRAWWSRASPTSG